MMVKMEEIDKDYKQQNWKVYIPFFSNTFNRDVASLISWFPRINWALLDNENRGLVLNMNGLFAGLLRMKMAV